MNQEPTQEPTQAFCRLGTSLRARYQAAAPTPTREYERTLHRYFDHLRTCESCRTARNELLAARLYARE